MTTERDILQQIANQVAPGSTIRDPETFTQFLQDKDTEFRNFRVSQDVVGIENRIRGFGQEPIPLPPGSSPDDQLFERSRQLGTLDPEIQAQGDQQFRQILFGLNPLAASIGQAVSGVAPGGASPGQAFDPQISPTLLPDNTFGRTVAELTSPFDVLLTGATAGAGPAIAGGLRGLGRGGRAAANVFDPVLQGSLPARLAAETAVGGAATAGAIETGERLPENTPGALRIAAQLGAGVVAGGAAAGGISGGRGAARAIRQQGADILPVGTAQALDEGVRPDLPEDPFTPEDLQIVRDQIDQQALGALDEPSQQAAQVTNRARTEGTVIPLPRSADELASQVQATEGVVGKLTTLVEGFQKLDPAMRANLQAARTRELGRRAGIARSLRENVAPERRGGAIRSAQTGELPQLADFQAIRNMFDESEFRTLHSRIAQVIDLPFDEANAHGALDTLLTGKVPTPSEMRLLERAFGPEFRRAVEEITKTRGRKAWETFISAVGLPRGVLASFDISAVMRQGGVLSVSHPKKAFFGRDSAFARMMKALVSEDAAAESLGRIRSDTDFQLLDDAGWFVRDIFETNLTAREEIFISRWIQRIPGVRASERAFSTYLNEITHKVQKDWINNMRAQGLDDAQLRSGLDRMTEFMNVSTGRGSLGVAERSQLVREMATVAFWSPRLLASRIQTPLAGARALRNFNAADPAIRAASRQIARDLATYVGGMISFLSFLDISGLAEVEADPRSSDFGKIRVGNTRLDTWAGFQQIARYTAQLITGQRKSASRAEVSDIRDRSEIVGRFIRSKLAPGPVSIAASSAPEFGGITGSGENFIGESVTPGQSQEAPAIFEAASGGQIEETDALLAEIVNQITPLMLQDIEEALKEQGLNGALLSTANLVGIGSTSFDSPEAETASGQVAPAQPARSGGFGGRGAGLTPR